MDVHCPLAKPLHPRYSRRKLWFEPNGAVHRGVFAIFLPDGFTTMAVIINPPMRKLAKRTSVQWSGTYYFFATWYNKPAIAAYFVMYLLVGTKSILP